ncbi:hypothetical protein Q9L58_010261 [Maublancomyces gigas]|uniref:Uncharacterized protein n=1 Tax=Discina gigas TaxID=1032678 RepID=A0ABR3G4P2_9PEZI
MVTRLKAQPPPPVPHRGPPTQKEEESEVEKADEDVEMDEAEKGEERAERKYEEGPKYGEEYGERSDDEDTVKATQSKQKAPSMVRRTQQMRTPSPTPEPGPRPIKLSWCEANLAEVIKRARQWEVIEARMDRWMVKERGTKTEKVSREGHEEKEAKRAKRTKERWVKRGLGEEQILMWAEAIKVELTGLDWECWVVRNMTSEGGYRRYRLDMKDGETMKKLTYVGPREEPWTKWGRRETREDKGYGRSGW